MKKIAKAGYKVMLFGSNKLLPTIALVTTGGTIAQKPDMKTGVCMPFASGEDLILNNPLLLSVANIRLVEFSNLDSSQMSPEMWADLTILVNRILQDKKIDGVVITHGTDTMAEGAYFLDLLISSKKPVVFTGTMRNAFALSFDGPANLYNAIVQASSKEAHDWGVTINLNQYIHSARDAAKMHTTNTQTFSSGIRGCLGYVENKVVRFHDCPSRIVLALPKKLAKVALVKIAAGDDGRLVMEAGKFGIDGIVIEGFGAGNVNSAVYEAIKGLIKQKIAVVITSQVYEGGVAPIYGAKGCGATLQDLKTIFGGDLPGNKARILLMLLLPQVGSDYRKLEKYFGS